MTSLMDLLGRVPLGRTALLSPAGEMTYGDIRRMVDANESVIKMIGGTNVVINGRDRFEFSKILFLLDGKVNNILFIPPDIDQSLHNRYYQEVNINYEVYLEKNILRYKTISSPATELNPKETFWIIPTSGTTNIPKLVAHTFNSLTRSTKANIEIGSDFVWGLVFDIYRFSGIQVFLQAMLSGSSLIVTESQTGLPAVIARLTSSSCNALSATPSFWRKALMCPGVDKLNLRIITLGGEIADKTILECLRSNFPESKITHIYASTEAGVGFSVSDGLPGFPKSYIDSGLSGMRLGVSETRTLMIRNVIDPFSHLLNENLYDNCGFVDTGDVLDVQDDRVYFLGRDSGAINVGGNKVQPEEVESVLLSSGFVSAAFVYPKKSAIIGNIVCANLVLQGNSMDGRALKGEIMTHCRASLESFKVPAIIKFVDDIETTHSGKLKRS